MLEQTVIVGAEDSLYAARNSMSRRLHCMYSQEAED
jgi:hypothetical protein